MGKFTPHTILQRKGKRGSVVRGREESTRQGSRKRTGETLETQGVLNIGEESNLRPGLFFCIRRRRVTFILDFR
jgi:hypothetical protein